MYRTPFQGVLMSISFANFKMCKQTIAWKSYIRWYEALFHPDTLINYEPTFKHSNSYESPKYYT